MYSSSITAMAVHGSGKYLLLGYADGTVHLLGHTLIPTTLTFKDISFKDKNTNQEHAVKKDYIVGLHFIQDNEPKV